MTDETKAPEEPVGTATEPEGEEKKPARLNQTVEMNDVGPCKKHIKITIDRGDIDTRLNDKFSELVVESNVAGFRPGKAPRKIIEKRFKKEVNDQLKGELMMQSLEQLAEENDIAPLSPPELDPSKIEIPNSGPMIYEFDVEVRPQFDLPDYKGLKLRRPIRTFTDADVEDQQRRLLSPYGQVVPKPEGSAQIGDVLVCDVQFQAHGQMIGQLKEITFRVEQTMAFKDGVANKFGEQVKGANAGDKRTVDIILSENVADPALTGQPVKALLEVKEVKTIRMPEVTHELCHEFGVHSAEQLRERIRVLLERRLEYAQRQSARQQVLEKIASAANWDLPQDLLVRQARAAMGRRVMEMRASGMSDNEINARMRLLQQDVLRSTGLALKEHFVLQKIAEVEKIEVSDDDINDEVERIAQEYNESPRRIRARLEKEDLIESLAIELIERKVLDMIFETATYEDFPMDAEEAAETSVSTVEEQAVPGEMKDPTAPPAAEEPKSEGT